ncbi:mediator of RNA polymerase II transcription subunit 16 [Epargyreus clarus]|uniref:mediator of RNA polymerase II transcription subunit 16 n=1 Tax=Epargyreus clarus TaxID=520877 RepID=UPI003C2FC7C0
MELIYSMRRKSLKCEPPHFETTTDPEVTRPLCTISTCNIIAFSSLTELSDADGDSWGGHVYVCDLDTPWESHKVTSTVHPVSAIEWDIEGKQLLVATTEGDVSVYTQKDYLLNEWTCLYSASFPGEHIIKASFFHNGRRIAVAEKKPDAPISDRIQMLRQTPTLKGFGGVAVEGALIVTGTGLLGAAAAGDGARALTATDGRPVREHVVAAEIAHKGGGTAGGAGTQLVALAWRRGARRGVRCAAVSVARAAARAPALALAAQPLPALCLLDDDAQAPMSIAWCLREDTDSLLVAGTTLTLWKLTERSFPVHKLLSKGPVQGSTTPGSGQKTGQDCFNTVVWQQTAVWPVEGGQGARHITSTKLPLGPPHAVLATPRALHLIARDNHHYLCSRALSSGSGAAAETPATAAAPPKKAKYGGGALPSGGSCATVSCVEMSTFGGLLVAVDTHSQLHVYKLPQPWAENIPTPLSVQHATLLLEYAMVSGYDYLDILMTIKPNIVEALYERFTETFQRQPQTFQQYYFHHWLKIRIALCSVSPGTLRAAGALAALQAAAAAWAACGAALRPDDKPDALDDLTHPEHDKSLLALEAKADVPTEGGTLQALQALQPLRRLLERAVDITLTALAALPLPNTHHQPHGYELWADPRAVGLLRKLVVAARACGRGGEPLSRPLARLANNAQLKADLLEECASLTAQWPSRVWELLPRCCVAAPHGRPWPLCFEYGTEPEYLRYSPEPPPYAQCDFPPLGTMDAIRYMYLGGGRKPRRWRQCGRCGARALPASQPTKHPLQRAYDARFLAACKCGGKWTLFCSIQGLN